MRAGGRQKDVRSDAACALIKSGNSFEPLSTPGSDSGPRRIDGNVQETSKSFGAKRKATEESRAQVGAPE
jgi:hypothetical protein